MVTARELLDEAERRGARFKVLGDRLTAAPAHCLTPTLVLEIGRHKANVISEIHRRDVEQRVPRPSSRQKCAFCKRIDICYNVTEGSCCPSCAEWRTTCSAFVVLASPTGDGRRGACLSCGGAWELHGAPHPDAWHLVGDAEAVALVEAQLVVASARAILTGEDH